MSQSPRSSRRGPTAHVFGQPRPSGHTPQSQASPLVAGSPFQPLPTPPGKAPYRLDLATVVPDAVARMREAGGMVLHMAGDTGGVRNPDPQTLVAAGMERDAARASPLGTPALFYNLGDVIYFDGEASQYYPQFCEPTNIIPTRSRPFPATMTAMSSTTASGSIPNPRWPPSCATSARPSRAGTAGMREI